MREFSEADIQTIVDRVRQVLAQLPDDAPVALNVSPIKLVTEAVVEAAEKAGQTGILTVENPIITPLAIDLLRKTGINLESKPDQEQSRKEHVPEGKTVVVAADDQGRSLKTTLVHYLKQNGFEVLDQGIASDYVAAADVVAEALSQRRCRWGVVLDGAGVTSAAAANRNRDVAAAACWDGLSAKLARQRLDANILCLGANLITSDQAKEIAKKFLCT